MAVKLNRRTWGVLLAGIALLSCAWWGGRWSWVSWELRSARAELNGDRSDKALPRLQRLARFSPQHAEVQYLLGRALRREGRLEDAHDALNRAEKLGYSKPLLRAQRYMVLIQMGKMDEAAPFISELLTTNHDDEIAGDFYDARVRGFLSRYELADAMLCLKYWSEWRPDAAAPHFFVGTIRDRTQQWDEAIKEYRRAIELQPDHLQARLGLARMLETRRNAALALKEYQETARLFPKNLEARLGCLTCARQLNQLENPQQELEAVLVPELLEQMTVQQRSAIRRELADLALNEQRPEEALRWLLEAEKEDTYNQHLHQQLGLVYARLKQPDKAKAEFARARKLNELLTRLGEVIYALIEDTSNADLRCEAGEIFMEQGEADEGAAWLLTAVQFNPYHIKANTALSSYYAARGNKTLALKHEVLAKQGRERGRTEQAQSDSSGKKQPKRDSPGIDAPKSPSSQVQPGSTAQPPAT